jgi:hypothetical protein
MEHISLEDFSIRWQDGSPDSDYVIRQPGLYTLTATDPTGCFITKSKGAKWV